MSRSSNRLEKGALVRVDMASSESGTSGTLKWMLTPKLADI